MWLEAVRWGQLLLMQRVQVEALGEVVPAEEGVQGVMSVGMEVN